MRCRMTEMPSSLTPKSSRRSRMSCARERSTSENISSGSVCGGTSQPASIQASSKWCSRRVRIRNSWTEIISNLQVPAGVLSLPRLPAAREFLDLRIDLLRQHDLERHVLVAMRFVAARRALASQSQHGAGVRAFGHRHAHRSGRRGNIELCSEYCFGQADRQFEVDVVALAGE